jgi:hypothetical protein
MAGREYPKRLAESVRLLLAWETAIVVTGDRINNWTLCLFESPRVSGHTGTGTRTGSSRRCRNSSSPSLGVRRRNQKSSAV